ncbi:MAG: HEPN domain-containing protein [Bacteroidota bacterium]
MKTSLDQLPKALPPEKIAELEKVVEIIKYRFELDKDDPKFNLEMIILFGSYARGTWVEETRVKKGITHEYKSDFDILVVTGRSLSRGQWMELCIEEHLDSWRSIETEVNIIHHGISKVNRKLEENNYFFTDVVKDGVMLYDSGNYTFAEPNTLAPQEKAEVAQEDLEYWMKEGDDFYKMYESALEKELYKKAAFNLHQATECYYTAILLVFLEYKPRSHNIYRLRKEVNSIDERFKDVFPNTTKEEERRFELLKRAYIDARYKKDYTITLEELKYLGGRNRMLRAHAWKIAPENIARLRGMKSEA